MKKIILILSIITGIVLFTTVTAFDKKPGNTAMRAVNTDSLVKDRAKFIAMIQEKIKGKENWPADSVFKRLKLFKKVPAKQIAAIMENGLSKSLGVSCGHCHNTSDFAAFASEEKKEKQIARDMFGMVNKINNDLLKNIDGLKSAPAIINCTSCHRGQTKPALNIN